MKEQAEIEFEAGSFREQVTAGRLNEALRKYAEVAREGNRNEGEDGEGIWVGGMRLGIVQGAGPLGEEDFGDSRYFVAWARAVRTIGDGDELALEVQDVPGVGESVVATNLAEGGRHCLLAGSYVFVGVETLVSDAHFWFFMPTTSWGAVAVKVGSTEGGGGKYGGWLALGEINPTLTADLAMPMGMSVSSDYPALILNVCESGVGTNSLQPGSYCVGMMVGKTSGGEWIILIETIVGDEVWVSNRVGTMKHVGPDGAGAKGVLTDTGVGFCGFVYDSCGHVVGHFEGSTWISQWGFADPRA